VNRLLISLLLAACDPAISRSYMGEPIGELRGSIDSEIDPPPPNAEVTLLWMRWRGVPGSVVGTRTPVEDTSPATVAVTLYHPPPDDALNVLPADRSENEPRIAVAWIAVMQSGAATTDQNVLGRAELAGVRPGSVFGWAEDHVLAYVDRDVPTGSWAEEILSGTAERGFHLMRASGKGGGELEEISQCREEGKLSSACTTSIDPLAREADGSEAVVRLAPDLSALRLPVFALPDAVEEELGAGL
jgi:hypothetical protein